LIEYLQSVLAWVAQHTMLALAVVFFCCIGESIIVLGVLIPTTVVLCGAGALVALGTLPFWTVAGLAVAGAVIGDGINFWIGRRWGNRALESHYAQRYQEPIAQSRRLFERHGAKALVLARFIGLVRPFIAAIAGAYGMSPLRFVLVELFAGALWAIPLVALGLVFGTALSLAAEVATRLAILLVALFVLLGLLIWAVTASVAGLQRHAEDWLGVVLDWSHRHRRVGRLGEWLTNPHQPETPALAILAALLFGLGWLWLWSWWGWGHPSPGPFDTLAWQGAQELRTPLTTALALGVAQLADWQVYAPVAVTVLVTLLLTRRTRATAHWLAAVAFGTALSLGLYWGLKVPDPVNYYRGLAAVRFGGRDLVLATVIYGFVPVLLATQRSQAVRAFYYAAAASLIVLMLVADVYLGVVWLSTGLFAVTFGGVWVALLGIGYWRHGAEPIAAREVLPLALGVLIAATALQSSAELRRELDAQDRAERRMTAAQWWNGGFGELPAYRVDAAGLEKQPLSVQWRGDIAKVDAALRAAGWQTPSPLSWGNALRWLAVSEPLAELPVVPQIHAGHAQVLMLRLPRDDGEQWVLRLWPSGWQVGSTPLWIGTLTRQTAQRAFRLVHYPRTDREYDAPLAALAGPLPGFEGKRLIHPRREPESVPGKMGGWSGAVWLLRPKG
jgi:undecaprenyl-diphosphatase